MSHDRRLFQSRYRAASHFRIFQNPDTGLGLCFNLVIERLLISGRRAWN